MLPYVPHQRLIYTNDRLKGHNSGDTMPARQVPFLIGHPALVTWLE